MKKLFLIGLLIALGPRSCFADDVPPIPPAPTPSFWAMIKNQIITQTEFTATKSGGAAAFYDLVPGNSSALRVGVIDHVLSNRFLRGDIGYLSGTDGHVAGVAVFGPSVQFTQMFSYFFPTTSDTMKLLLIPAAMQNVDFGAFVGWGTDSWTTHYGISVSYDFGN